MFVLKNAWAAVVRRKWRTLLAVVVTLLVSFGSMFGLAVLAENDTANGTAYDAQQPQAVMRLTEQGFADRDGADPGWADDNLLTWSDYTTYATAAQAEGLQFEYTVTESLPVRQSDSIQAIQTGDGDENADDTGGELTLKAFYTLTAARANDTGRYKVVEGKHLSYSGNAPRGALISRELADENGLEVGDTITVGDPSDASTTYELTVRGIYEYVEDAPEGQGDDAALSKDNRDNAIYISYYTFAVELGLDTDSGTGWSTPDLNIMFTMTSPADYETFAKAVKDAGLPDDYEVASPSLEAYEASIAPLGDLAATMRVALPALWIGGAVILLAIVVSGACRRRDEIGSALVVGVSKARLGWQFMLETWMPLLPAFVVGALAGGFASGPLGAALAGGHETAVLADSVWHVIWYGVGAAIVLAVVAMLRVAFFPMASLFGRRDDAASAGHAGAAATDEVAEKTADDAAVAAGADGATEDDADVADDADDDGTDADGTADNDDPSTARSEEESK